MCRIPSQLRNHGVAVLLVAAAACTGCTREPDSFPGDEWCLQAGYAIASRSFTCEGDADVANERYERLMGEYACVPDVTNAGPGCSQRLLELTCDQVSVAGDDLQQWLNLGQCAQLQKKVASQPQDGGSDG